VHATMPDGQIEWSCSGDAQRCESSFGKMAVIDDSLIQTFLEMLNSECLGTIVSDFSWTRHDSKQVSFEVSQLCVSSMDSQEI